MGSSARIVSSQSATTASQSALRICSMICVERCFSVSDPSLSVSSDPATMRSI